ncbi:MAG: iron-sulfur cluster assembly scaffold protein [Patescibacteria group bacterium]|nr:iron-sulfur cluster assembly scaffold protein [Patescibacteria group bacterium]
MLIYSKKVIQYFKYPKNMGAMKNFDVQAEKGNAVCGDTTKIYLKINGNKIKALSFETTGCIAAIATSSIITEMAKGKMLAQAEKISYNDLAKELGGLPVAKAHCADMAIGALRKAIEKYKKSNQ